ncbi:RluA family pseudouridine synthase [Agaribacterium sp. ZY112]|uniref:RluA family pseudouridine synthase n=1 Tax=Agaribacterium sp. ZY112 TaxID=3233574 RepID=UPI0035249B65
MTIELIYQDSDLIVTNKPSGLLCVPGLSEPDNLFDRVKSEFKNARVVHRLDMATSGLVIFALNHETQKGFTQLFEKRQMQKEYCAEVYGKIEQQHGEIISPMMCDWPQRPRQKIDWHEGKPAHTLYHVLETKQESTRVKLKPITGRTHQLRLHMLQLGHPILGDKFYNLESSEKQASRLLLHAEELRFTHPISREVVQLSCPPTF